MPLLKNILKAPILALGHTRIMGTLLSARTDEKLAALTFDDGPDPASTPRLLDIFREYGAHASFFTLGANVAKHPQIVARALAEGHAICNHSWSHTSFPTLDGRARREELRRWRALVGREGSPYFRPPYGHQNIATRLDALRMGYTSVTWDVVVEDWRQQDADQLFANLASKLHPGCIVLLHDAITVTDEVTPGPDLMVDRAPVIEAVRRLLESKSGEYRFVSLPELLARARPHYGNWYRFNPSVA